MITFLADEDFNARIIRGVLRRLGEVDLLTVRAAGLAGKADATVISWAAENHRVVLSHDVNTLIEAGVERLRRSQPMRGLIAVPQQLAIGAAISDLVLIATCAQAEDLDGQIWYLPL